MIIHGKKKVCMFVYNSFRPDVRVLKEAKSLSNNGYDVRVLALLDNNSIPYQEYNCVKVDRIERNPLDVRAVNWITTFRKRFSYNDKNKSAFKKKYFIFNILNKLKVLLSICKRQISTIAYFLILIWAIESFDTKRLIVLIFDYKLYSYVGLLLLIANRKWILSKVKEINRVQINIRKKIKQYKTNSINKCQRFFILSVKKTLYPFHSYFLYYDYYCRCYKKIRLSPSNIYHAHDLNTLIVAWWCKKRLGGKLVYDSHELFTEQSMLKKSNKIFWYLIERSLIKECDKVITVCDSIAEELRGRYKVELPKVLKNCPDRNDCRTEEKGLIRKVTGIDAGTPIILYQGGYSNNRGLRKLLMASHYLSKGKLVMMGWGNIEDELKEFVKLNKLQDKVCFIPPAPQDDLLFWSASADIGIIPYRAVGLNNYYSCPNKLFEYINSGLPVVGSAFPEISKIINGWNLGRTFNPENPKSIANSVNEILSDVKFLESMRLNAIKASEVLNWQCESTKLLKIYIKLGR